MFNLVCCCCLLLLFNGRFEQVASKKQQYLIRPSNLECLKNPIPEECYRRGPFLFSAPRIGRRSSSLNSEYLDQDYPDLGYNTHDLHQSYNAPWPFFLITPNYYQQADQPIGGNN